MQRKVLLLTYSWVEMGEVSIIEKIWWIKNYWKFNIFEIGFHANGPYGEEGRKGRSDVDFVFTILVDLYPFFIAGFCLGEVSVQRGTSLL